MSIQFGAEGTTKNISNEKISILQQYIVFVFVVAVVFFNFQLGVGIFL